MQSLTEGMIYTPVLDPRKLSVLQHTPCPLTFLTYICLLDSKCPVFGIQHMRDLSRKETQTRSREVFIKRIGPHLGEFCPQVTVNIDCRHVDKSPISCSSWPLLLGNGALSFQVEWQAFHSPCQQSWGKVAPGLGNQECFCQRDQMLDYKQGPPRGWSFPKSASLGS